MDVAKEFIKRSPGHVLMILAVGAIVLGGIYIVVGSNNATAVQIGVLQQKVNDLEHEIELIRKDYSSCKARLEACQGRGFVKVK